MSIVRSAQERCVYRVCLPVKMFNNKHDYGFFSGPKNSDRDVYVHRSVLEKYGFTPLDMKKKGVEADLSYVILPHGLETVNIHRIGDKCARRRSERVVSALISHRPGVLQGCLVDAKVTCVRPEQNFGFLRPCIPEIPQVYFRLSDVPKSLQKHVAVKNWFRVRIEIRQRGPVAVICEKRIRE